jgi:hypothetical protein
MSSAQTNPNHPTTSGDVISISDRRGNLMNAAMDGLAIKWRITFQETIDFGLCQLQVKASFKMQQELMTR